MKHQRNKRGQITLFVIIGALLLLGVVLFFILSKNLSEDKPGIDIPDVSLEARPAHLLVTSCLETTTQEGLRLIGQNGGTFHPKEVSSPSYRGSAISYEPSVIPFWRHLTDCDASISGCEEVFIPPLCSNKAGSCGGALRGEDSIQEQLELYIEDNIGACVNNFAALGEQYDVSLTGKADASVAFYQEETVVNLDYPITIMSMSTDNTKELSEFAVALDVDMLGLYELATDILAFERRTNYLELQTMNLVALYADKEGVLPPLSGMSFVPGAFNVWIQQEVKNIVQNDLLPFMGLVQFVNTKNFRPVTDGIDAGEYQDYVDGFYSRMTPTISEKYYDFNAYTSYLYEDIFLEINEGDQIIKPDELVSTKEVPLLRFINIDLKDYRFDYHMSYPLLFILEDDDAFDDDGFYFQFAVEVNVRNNVPAYQNFTYAQIQQSPSTGIGDLEQRLPQEITVESYDKHTGESLSDVIITYVCGNEFEIGATSFDAFGKASLTSQFPYCEYGGQLRFQKHGFLGESIPFNNRVGDPTKTFEVELWPIQEKEIIIYKRTQEDLSAIDAAGEDGFLQQAESYSSFDSNEQVLFSIDRKKVSEYDTQVPLLGFLHYADQSENLDVEDMIIREKATINKNYDLGIYNESVRDAMLTSVDTMYESYQQPEVQETYTLEMVPGTYFVDMTLLDKTPIYFPAYDLDIRDNMTLTERFSSSIFTDKEDLVVKLPEQNFSTWVTGLAELNFTISEDQLYTSNPVEFFILEKPAPQSWPDMLDYEDLETYQEGKEDMMLPTY
ncbi:MAG: hypothetical protein ACOCQQ_01245 [Candidatus Nanoarchaeia archaeon]